MTEFEDLARSVIDENRYMVLGTADESGRPWVSPVWFASENYREFHWVSGPETQHSKNIETRPEVSVVVFDSTRVPGTAQAVYMNGTAEQLTDAELERGMDVYRRVSEADGLSGWTVENVQPPSLFRLYRATAAEHFVLIRGGDPQHGTGIDRRERVTL
jgi:nitroimidazol reductase NimA-like FMN-containing flavoprotein (pyridoxamine 5'-phosphate oxidase superfamily)